MPRRNVRGRMTVARRIATRPKRLPNAQIEEIERLFRVAAKTDRKIAARSLKTSERASVGALTPSTTAPDNGGPDGCITKRR